MDQLSEILATLLRLERKIDGHISHCKCQCSSDATVQHLPRAPKTTAINQCIDLLYSNVVTTLPGVITKLNCTPSSGKQEACPTSQQAKPATKAFSAVPHTAPQNHQTTANQVAPAAKAVITLAEPEARNVQTKKVTSTSDVNNNAAQQNITVLRSGRNIVKRTINEEQTAAAKKDNNKRHNDKGKPEKAPANEPVSEVLYCKPAVARSKKARVNAADRSNLNGEFHQFNGSALTKQATTAQATCQQPRVISTNGKAPSCPIGPPVNGIHHRSSWDQKDLLSEWTSEGYVSVSTRRNIWEQRTKVQQLK